MRGGKWNLGIISAVLSISLLALYAHRMLKCFPEDNLTCPKYNPSLVGRIKPNLTLSSFEHMERKFAWLGTGGQYSPRKCRPRERVAILVPFRERDNHLKIFLNNLHPILYRQQLEYTIYVIEQADDRPFNRGKLFNIGYMEAKKENNYTCFVCHDVDLIPENDQILYGCVRSPMHLSRAVDKFDYRLPYKEIMGGITVFSGRDYEKVNGWSNLFENWGGEDDDMSNRVIANGLSIFRFSDSVAKYTMLKHRRTPVNTARYRMLNEGRTRHKFDGLTSLVYKPPRIERHRLFTKISVSL
ncbi:beta-1,4-N-acetylgalactosaminyltransferase bre-4-like [Crassostrea virginica]